MDKDQRLEAMRHSLAHIMASAIKKLWPEVKFGVGPAIENGFFYDIDLGDTKLSDDQFGLIEREMTKIIKANQKFHKFYKTIDEALDWARDNDQPYKVELLNDLKRFGTTATKNLGLNEPSTVTESDAATNKVSFYENGDFVDLCRGPHVGSTIEVGAFKLSKIAGAYWKGKESNPQMQRLYGVAFDTQDELDHFLAEQQKAKEYDHRKLGQELDLFLLSPLVGSGLPLFTPRGTVLRDELNKYSQLLRKKIGYSNVWTPHIAKRELYEVSGHWSKFGNEWLTINSKESHDDLVMKPMNCPHHQQIYASRPRSYRDLPIKYMETTTDYRDEKAGELLGLSRVRSLTQDDSHIFCTPDQIDECLEQLINVVKEFYKTMGMNIKARLSFRDESDNYLGDTSLWNKAEAILKKIVENSHIDYYIAKGEAAFYGPKIDFMTKDVLGRELQLATPQLDFVQPERFGLKYVDKDGVEKTPVMIHFALMGSIERFLAAYIEHTKGKFPVWVAPEQVRLLTVNQEDNTVKFANKIQEEALNMGLRVTLDNSSQSVGKKIRESEIYKIPYTVVIGDKEIESGNIMPRVREDLKTNGNDMELSISNFLQAVSKESKTRTLKTTF
ncbi:MAG TPA: threonine--tRNA ligase [Candidatus Dormibacteraeota bacterium]|nr:threonine--tRNA ligase [Candidatus Dormibacteraeota bacterium]